MAIKIFPKITRLFTITLLLFLIEISFAQKQGQPLIDSLVIRLAQIKDDTLKVNVLERLSAAYYPISPDTGIIYGNESITLANNLKWDKLLGWSYNSIGVNYWAKSNFAMAMEYYLKALSFAELRNDSSLITGVLGNIGTIHYDQGDYQKSLEIDLRVIKLYENMGNTAAVARNMGNVAEVYAELKDYSKAVEYFNEALVLNKKLGRKLSMAINLQGLASIYRVQNDYSNALEYNFNALTISKDILNKKGMASCYHSIGRDYLMIVDSGKRNFVKKLSTLSEKKILQRAQLYIDSAISINESMGSLSVLAADYKVMIEIKEKAEDFKGALASHKKYTQLKDSISSLEYNKNTTEQLMQYEFDKKQSLAQAEQELKDATARRVRNLQFTAIGLILIISVFLYINYRQQQKQKIKIEKAYSELKSTQAQLIQSEKMASLGELTAGIAHEIQNPLNFVNNFSEVNGDLIKELKQELAVGSKQSADEILNDIESNSEKINHHGKRADGIVKSMLQHSRTSSGQKELTDINALCDEYLRLSFHGYRAKDKSFNAKFETDFDSSLPKISVLPQDIGRVVLNLINNAFYAVSKQPHPLVIVSTKNLDDKIEVRIKDNGHGIPESIKEKIFQPFFTTKPTGQGTGLGLSLSYDIVKAHGGSIQAISTSDGSEFVIQLPAD